MGLFKDFHYGKKQLDKAASDSEAAADSTLRDATPAELARGQYKKGEVVYMGLPVCIENPKGSTRSGDGWEVTFPIHYGEFRDHMGADGDAVDCFIGPTTTSQRVFICNQHMRSPKVFDEHKVFLGCSELKTAQYYYDECHTDDWASQVSNEWVETTIDHLKYWLVNGDKRLPFPQTDTYDYKLISLTLRRQG
ncbi:InPase domain-containing protein [Vibrio phage vB_VcorM_GR28A]|nr:InPase domain-containing protein [Vibrio phage vB_VcorM_GR28A]